MASEWSEAVAKVGETHPTVVLLDVRVVPERRRLVELYDASPFTKVVMLALSELESDVVLWIEAGIDGYVPCDASVEDIAEAVNATADGQMVCPPDLAAMLFRRLSESGRRKAHDVQHDAVRLTVREKEVVRLIANGLSNKRIAQQLKIRVGTVKNHVHRVLQKLDLRSRSQVAAWYYRQDHHQVSPTRVALFLRRTPSAAAR